MGSKNCMNELCHGTTSSDWKKGWSLKSGGFATLCYRCGSAYENSVFCETFHSEESGWRECRICRKRIHCGCIASRYLHEYMDCGGVGCISCIKHLENHYVQPLQIPNETFLTNGIRDVRPIVIENRIDDGKFSTERLLQLTKAISTNDGSSAQHRQDDSMFKTRQSSKRFFDLTQQSSPPTFFEADNSKQKEVVKDTFESPDQPSPNFSLTTPLSSSKTFLPLSGGISEGSEQSKGSLQGQRARPILPKPPKLIPGVGSETNKGSVSQARVARPPADGRGRNQLLPRYWPRITDQELQQLSGNLKSNIVPLFEKVLSASDAGRIGRLVLPKACAEAYFPAINQSEGIPIRVQDIKGKEWTFQFRFWPNNNSRMYVLEGVTPCMQTMQVQAGDTVIFSRIEPGGQLVIGCRKTTYNDDAQDSQSAATPSGDSHGETSFSGATGNQISQQDALLEKKKGKNMKNKRLLMNNDDAMELRVTWDEAQELLRPSPTAEPTVVMIEDQEIEEFDEPPVFGKRTVFTCGPSGEKEQLAQCDDCLKWRKLPLDAVLSVRWTCSENKWDSRRSSCSAPEDISQKDLEYLDSTFNDSRKRRTVDEKMGKEGEASGLDALATAAVLGDNISEAAAESSVGATTRHPRHRPGCTCIVCIQPPSGKGKHDPTCKCNVCLTVKRRFKTLMMRKKKRQSEREAELAKASPTPAPETENNALLNMNEKEVNVEETSKRQWDLNCDPPQREDDLLASFSSLMTDDTWPSNMFPGQNVGPSFLSQPAGENLGFPPRETNGTRERP
ncbi:hypothetical protein ACS0TY_008057 [Phlomoides rotata]